MYWIFQGLRPFVQLIVGKWKNNSSFNKTFHFIIPMDKFTEYFFNKGLGEYKFYKETNKFHYQFSMDDFEKICHTENVYNGVRGGLVLGVLHSEGGIHLVYFNPNTESFIYHAEIEGGEFISPPLLSNEMIKMYEEINNRIKFDFNDKKIDLEIPENCDIINTENKKNAIILISEYPHFIINRLVTKTYINELIELNNRF